jgi:hypothetical protein
MKRTLMMLGAMAGLASMAPSEAEARPIVQVSVGVPSIVVAPGPARVWVPAHSVWDARSRRNVVVPGHWKVAPRPAAMWVPGHWERRGRAKVWVNGYWTR